MTRLPRPSQAVGAWLLLCVVGGAVACGGERAPRADACQLDELQVSSRAQGGSGDVLGSIRLRSPREPCRIATRADISLSDAEGRPLPVRLVRAHEGSGSVRLGGRHSDSTAVVSIAWEEWCRGDPGETTITLRIPGSGALSDLDLFGGGYPGCVFEGRQKSVLRVSTVAVVDSSGQKLR